jgi:putative peptidoglycan lipid II flippase
MIVSLFAVGLNLLLNWIFTLRLGWGHRGLALSTGCIAISNFVILYMIMRRHLRLLETRAMATMLMKLAVASIALVIVCWAGQHFLLSDWASQAFWTKTAWLFVTIAVGGGVFVACALAMHIDEVDHLRDIVNRKLRRSPPATR